MKRALSLIIVLAMVLCMIPFSAFAADYDLAEDFPDGETITLGANETKTYLWTATEKGTLYVYAEEVVAEGAEAVGVEPYIEVDGAEYTDAGVAVEADQSYEITIIDNAMLGGDVKLWTNFIGEPGTETNPYEIYNPETGMGDGNTTTVEVPAGESVYYNLYYYAGMDVTFTGNGVKISALGETVDGTEAGYVTMTFGANDRMVLVKFTNKSDAAATYTVTAVAPNSWSNPEVVTVGTYEQALVAGNGGYFYSYTAEGNGTVNVTVSAVDAESNALGTSLTVNNPAASIYGDETNEGAASVEVSTGDVVEIIVGTYAVDEEGNPLTAPAGTVTTTIEFTAASTEEPDPEEPEDTTIVIESLPYTHTEAFSGEYNQKFSYTADGDFYLFVKADNGGYASLENIWMGVNEYQGGIVYKMTEGETVTIIAYSYDAEMGANIYTFDKLDEIEADGSYNFPYEWGSVLGGETSKTNETEGSVFYTYTAEKTGMLHCSAWWSDMMATEGEPFTIEVEAGTTAELYYLDPIALIGETEYFTIDAAVAAVASGETITLVANATAEAGLVLPAGANLDLGAYDLVAPYLVAFTGSVVTGDVAEASITASNLVADNVTISDVEYAWTATEGVYTLVAYEAPVVDDEPIVAEFNGEQMSLTDAIAAAAAVGTPDAPATVTLIANYEDADATVIIEPGVMLNIGAYTLTARNLIGLSGSFLTGTSPSTNGDGTDGCDIYVGRTNLVLSEKSPIGANDTYRVLPVWYDGHFILTQAAIRIDADDATSIKYGGGFVVSDDDNGTATFNFAPNFTTWIRKNVLMVDGTSEHDMDIIISVSWIEGDEGAEIEMTQEGLFSQPLQIQGCSNIALYAALTNCNAYKNLEFKIKYVTDSGAVMESAPYYYADYVD